MVSAVLASGGTTRHGMAAPGNPIPCVELIPSRGAGTHRRQRGSADCIGKYQGAAPLEIKMHDHSGEHRAILLRLLRPHQPGAVGNRFRAYSLHRAPRNEEITGA